MSSITTSCPYCHGYELGVNSFRKKGTEDTQYYTVACRNIECQAEGPVADSPEHAIEQWNALEEPEQATQKITFPSILQYIANFIVGGITISLLWAWFISPLGVPTISIVHGVGIDCLITFLTSKPKDFDDAEDHKDVESWLKYGIFLPLSFLMLGFIVHLLM